MQARQTRSRHFKSSLGSMLNENYDGGRLPAYPVKQEDFVYIPSSTLPVSRSALNFLQHKFPEPVSDRPATNTTSSSLYQAYRRAFEQPMGLVHYDRDPMYWGSKERKPRENVVSTPSSVKSLLMGDYGQLGLVPDDVPAASTPSSVSSVRSSQRGKQRRPASIAGVTPESVSGRKNPPGYVDQRNRCRLWSPDSEAAGFKPYTPFSGSLFDYDKQPKYNTPEIPLEVRKTMDVMAAPKYSDALREVVDASGFGSANVSKIHGNPQYPSKPMHMGDVPNYVAWTQIYPYCPLTQVQGQDKPVVVPPRGFTPSTMPPTPCNAKPARDSKKAKQKIFAGLEPSRTPEAWVSSGPAKKTSNPTGVLIINNAGQGQEQSKHLVDTSTTRRLLEMKLQAPDGFYGGQTPTHTPTPDPTLPIKASRNWAKHYSPARIRHFLHATAADGNPRV